MLVVIIERLFRGELFGVFNAFRLARELPPEQLYGDRKSVLLGRADIFAYIFGGLFALGLQKLLQGALVVVYALDLFEVERAQNEFFRRRICYNWFW